MLLFKMQKVRMEGRGRFFSREAHLKTECFLHGQECWIIVMLKVACFFALFCAPTELRKQEELKLYVHISDLAPC